MHTNIHPICMLISKCDDKFVYIYITILFYYWNSNPNFGSSLFPQIKFKNEIVFERLFQFKIKHSSGFFVHLRKELFIFKLSWNWLKSDLCGFETPTFQKIVCNLAFCRLDFCYYSKCLRTNPGFHANEDSWNPVINNKSCLLSLQLVSLELHFNN